jgi:hypothetical protein
MKTVLFAVDHMIPDKKALAYTLSLCRRMLARLDVLHIIQSPAYPNSRLNALKSGMRLARDAFENAMVTATFAEAGIPDPERALKAAAYDQFRRVLPKQVDPTLDYHCVVTGETSDAVIERYVHGHRNVVLTVLDAQSEESSCDQKKANRTQGCRVMPKLAVPLVLVKNA